MAAIVAVELCLIMLFAWAWCVAQHRKNDYAIRNGTDMVWDGSNDDQNERRFTSDYAIY